MDLSIPISGVRVEHNTIKYNAAFSACEEAQVWFRAMELLAEMADVRVRCTITYSAAISACGKVGECY